MVKLEDDLKRLLLKLEKYSSEYKDLKHQDRDEKCELIYRGKAEAYNSSASELRDLLKWYGILKD